MSFCKYKYNIKNIFCVLLQTFLSARSSVCKFVLSDFRHIFLFLYELSITSDSVSLLMYDLWIQTEQYSLVTRGESRLNFSCKLPHRPST